MSDDRNQADFGDEGFEVILESAKIKASSEIIGAFLLQIDKLGDPSKKELLRIYNVRKSEHSLDLFIYDLIRFILDNYEYVFSLVETYLQYLGGVPAENGQPVTKEQIKKKIIELSAFVRRRPSDNPESLISRAVLFVTPIRRIALGTLKGNIGRAEVRIKRKKYIISKEKIPENVKQELRMESEEEWIRSIKQS